MHRKNLNVTNLPTSKAFPKNFGQMQNYCLHNKMKQIVLQKFLAIMRN